jgi:carboxypeptidase Q
MRKLFTTLSLTCFLFIGFAQPSQQGAAGQIDQDMIAKIREEGLNKSQVMEIAFRLTDANGPRLTNSPGYAKAANWAISEMKKWGLQNAALEPWGEFGKGWELKKSYVAQSAPYYKPMIAYPKTWTKGTNGLKQAEVILIEAKDSVSLEAYKGKLKGKVVLLYRSDVYKPPFTADAKRYTDEDLEKMANIKAPQPRATDTAQQRRMREAANRAAAGPTPFPTLLKNLAEKEGAVVLLSTSPRGHDGTLFVQGPSSRNAQDAKSPEAFTELVITMEDYLSMCRLAKAGIPVKMDLDIATAFQTKDTKGYNVIAEIPGTDPNLKEELVMLGGHLDSWQGATGATDNAAGCAVMMEVVRILKKLDVKPRRTIRIALWSGEEQGLYGSRNYVKNHFADPVDMKLKPAHEKFSAYYNIDNGTGKIRGIYLQGNEAAREIFAEWLKPFNDLGAKTVTISNTGGTDHQAFDGVGLPGFQFIQDPIEYDTRTHHTNMDSYDHLLADDLKQISTIVAAFVYNTAMRDEKIPRKPLPAPRGQ